MEGKENKVKKVLRATTEVLEETEKVLKSVGGVVVAGLFVVGTIKSGQSPDKALKIVSKIFK